MKRVKKGDESGESRMIAKHCRVHVILFPQRRVAREGMNVVRVRDKEQERRERGRERERKV